MAKGNKVAKVANPSVNSNGTGMWGAGTSSNGSAYSGSGNPMIGKNALSLDSDATVITDFHGGRATAGSSGGASADQGTGATNAPSPSQSLLGKANTSSADQGTGATNQPSPDQNLLSSKSAFSTPSRPSCFGGVEKGIQIQ